MKKYNSRGTGEEVCAQLNRFSKQRDREKEVTPAFVITADLQRVFSNPAEKSRLSKREAGVVGAERKHLLLSRLTWSSMFVNALKYCIFFHCTAVFHCFHFPSASEETKKGWITPSCWAEVTMWPSAVPNTECDKELPWTLSYAKTGQILTKL